ncbi:unnamed protein product [Penicillium discolor]
MNYTTHSSAPSGPRSYQGNAGGRNNRENNNRNGNAPFVPNGPRYYQSNGGARNYRGNNNYNGNANRNGSNRWNGHGNHNNQWDNHQNESGNVNPTDNGTGNANNGNPNYKGKNFNPNYKGKNYNPNFTRPVPANVDQARNGNRRRPSNNNNHRGLQSQYNIDVQMAEAPSDEPNDIEMPDAPPLPDPRIEAFTMGALAVKEIVSPPLSHFQFNPRAFSEPTMDPLAFRSSPSNHPVAHLPISTHPAFGTSAFNYPVFRRPPFRPPTFHPPAAETMLRIASDLDPSYVPN